jgi:hypothetical protein
MLYGCKTWSFTLRTGNKLMILVSTWQKIMGGRKREKMTKVCRKTHGLRTVN